LLEALFVVPLETACKTGRTYVWLLAEDEACEELLKLIKNTVLLVGVYQGVISKFSVWSDLLPAEDHFSKVRGHEKSLKQTIHVAGAALILQTFILPFTRLSFCRMISIRLDGLLER
jgi:hypothetical protein